MPSLQPDWMTESMLDSKLGDCGVYRPEVLCFTRTSTWTHPKIWSCLQVYMLDILHCLSHQQRISFRFIALVFRSFLDGWLQVITGVEFICYESWMDAFPLRSDSPGQIQIFHRKLSFHTPAALSDRFTTIWVKEYQQDMRTIKYSHYNYSVKRINNNGIRPPR